MPTHPVELIDHIVSQNLGVYRASPPRLQEDVTQEAQVAEDYRGRLVYELLQNADDAMGDSGGRQDRVSFLVTEDELWIANSGRSLTDSDVQGLCGLGASSKVDAQGVRRASIGHKGLGFKSVLEITARPAVFSLTYSFELGRDHARRHVAALWQELGSAAPSTVPAMRFPQVLESTPEQWTAYRDEGFNTAFRLPFADTLRKEQRASLGRRLLDLPLTTVLFLKHLERVYVTVEDRGERRTRRWNVRRERLRAGAWEPVHGLAATGLYRVTVETDDGESASFVVAHDQDVPIGDHRVGLSGPAWEGVDLTEVSVAALVPGSRPRMPAEWRHFHVFLPTLEPCPYPLLVNGAFATDLSRQQVRVSPEAGDYNAHLIRQAARLIRESLLPVLAESGPEAALAVLERSGPGVPAGGPAAELLHDALVEELAHMHLVRTELGDSLVLPEVVLPPAVLELEGAAFRDVLVEDAGWDGRRFPAAALCTGRWVRVAADHGARELEPAEAAAALAKLSDPVRSALVDDRSGGFEIDPVLELCTTLWERVDPRDRTALEGRARSEQLFPVHRNDDRTVQRVSLEGATAFYPPRSARHDLPLHGLRFMCHALCWGALFQKERLAVLEGRMKAWTALFDIKDFRFDEVVRAAVLPALVLNPDPSAKALLETLQDVRAIAAVCQLAGRFVKPDRPLRYQRLEGDRSQFNMSRLPVPCRDQDGVERWLPAYRVYFGGDWIGNDSIERVVGSIAKGGPAPADLNFAYLAPPERLLGTLDLGGSTAAGDGSGDDEVDLDEDADQALESTERDRWIAFLSWIGVNRALRPVHFHDVEDDKTGWLTTRHLSQPKGWAFRELGEPWVAFQQELRSWLDRRRDADDVVPYLYEAHDLEAIVPLLAAAEHDASGEVGRSLFEHLVRHWSWYSGFAQAQVALVGKDKWPTSRNKPQRALPEELKEAGDNLWLLRLKSRAFCPTTQGPRRPGAVWAPSPEIERRFGRRGQFSGDLLPILEVGEGLPAHSVRSLSERLGVRSELSPSTFGVEDAAQVCRQLERRFAVDSEPGIDAYRLRHVIKPVYREMFELLSGRSFSSSTSPPLLDAPLLANTSDGLRFLPAREVLFASAPGIRERSGLGSVAPTFILEAEPAATAPLTKIFGVRLLEDALEWQPSPGEPALDNDEVGELRHGLRELARLLLARIRAQRTDAHDRRVLLEFADQIEAVDHLRLSCSLDGIPLNDVAERQYFVRPPRGDEPLQAFIVWEGPAWPPVPEVAQRLAMALADALGMNLVETFLAFIQSNEQQRLRLLDVAGAKGMLEEDDEPDPLPGGEGQGPTDGLPPTLPEGLGDGSTESSPRVPTEAPTPAAPPVALLRFEDLLIDGQPLTVFGQADDGGEHGHNGHQNGRGGTRGTPRHAPAGTDLAALDHLGMGIALGYEIRRLRRKGCTSADLLSARTAPNTSDSMVVDVHSPEAIARAEGLSPVVASVMAELESRGISRLFPGFDILTIAGGQLDRMIELKSSGVDARVQEMSWNEWKTARASVNRTLFWLYLVGNLRADLGHARPFLRAINDPFGTLAASELADHQIRRVVQLRVREFKEAEQLDIGVRRARALPAHGAAAQVSPMTAI